MNNEIFIDGEGMVGIGVVEPVLVNKVVDPAKETQTFLPPDGVDGFNRVVVLPIPDRYPDTSDATAMEDDILIGKTAYSVDEKRTGTMPNRGNWSDIITDKTDIISIPKGYHNGNGTIKLSNYEANKIIPSNIKKGISILGVAGGIQYKNVEITPTTSEQTITPPVGYDAFDEITVNPIKVQSKTVKSTTISQTITPDSNYDGINEITVSPIVLQNKNATPTKQSQTITPDTGNDALGQVVVDAIPAKFFDINEYAMSDASIALALETATEVKAYNFYSARKITSLTGPELVNIGNYAFAECPNFTSVLAAKLNAIGSYGFFNCQSLTSFTAPIIKRLGFAAFRGCTGLTSFSNFKTLTYIGESAFNGCTSLTFTDGELEMTGPTIYGNAFNGVSGIQKINFSGSPDLQAYSFNALPNLETVCFQQDAQNISALAFLNCPNLTDIYVPWSSTDSINANAPLGATGATIHYETQYQDGEPVI